MDYGLPFLSTEQDYTGSFKYKSIGNKTFEAIYAFSRKGYYKRQNSATGFGAENKVYGFIYPTRTIKYADDYRLVLMRKDGAIPETCADVDQATMYLLEENRHLHVIKFGNKNWAQLLCYNSNNGGVLQDADDIAVYMAKRKGAPEISDGVGGGGSIGDTYIPPNGNSNLTPESGYGNTPQFESYTDPNHKHAISMDDTVLSIRGKESYNRKWVFTQYDVPTVDLRTKMKEKLGKRWSHNQLYIQWWLSPNNTFTTYDVLLGTDSPKSDLKSHQKHRERMTGVKGLKNLSPGKYWIYPRFIFPADNQGNVQYNMASNQDKGEYIEVTILPKYDFETTWFSSNKYVVKTKERLSLWVNATSYGGMFPYDVRVGLYVSGEGYDNKLFFAKVFHPNGNLGTAFEVKTIAPALPGKYTLKCVIDDEKQHSEWDETNNQIEFPLTVTARGPDAAIGLGFQVQSTETYNGWQGQEIHVSSSEALEARAIITNNGDEKIVYSEMSFKISTDLDFNQEDDWHFAWTNSHSEIKPGGAITQTATLVAPYEPGTYYLYGYIPVVTGESDNPERNWWNNKSRNDTILEFVKIIVE